MKDSKILMVIVRLMNVLKTKFLQFTVYVQIAQLDGWLMRRREVVNKSQLIMQ